MVHRLHLSVQHGWARCPLECVAAVTCVAFCSCVAHGVDPIVQKPRLAVLGCGKVVNWLENGKGHLSLGKGSAAKLFSYFQEERMPLKGITKRRMRWWAWVYRDGGSAAVLMYMPGGSVLYWASDGKNEATATLVPTRPNTVSVSRGIPLNVYAQLLPAWMSQHKWAKGLTGNSLGFGPPRNGGPRYGFVFLRMRRFLWSAMKKSNRVQYSASPVPVLRISDPDRRSAAGLEVRVYFHGSFANDPFPISGATVFLGEQPGVGLAIRHVRTGTRSMRLPIHRIWAGKRPPGFKFERVPAVRLSDDVLSAFGKANKKLSVRYRSMVKLFLRWAGGPGFVVPGKMATTLAASTGQQDYLAGMAALRLRRYGAALQFWHQAATEGSGEAMYQIASLYRHGHGVGKDLRKAVAWYRKAAARGNADAAFKVGVAYGTGRGVSQDYAKAMRWYLKAAAQGNADAKYNIGVLYSEGDGVSQNYAKAMNWYHEAATAGNVGAMNNIGVLYSVGGGVPQDFSRAVAWYRKGAAGGSGGAMYNLGTLYAEGRGVPQDYAKAMELFSKAAALGNADAMYAIGMLYRQGWGVPNNLSKAKAWFQKAAAAGDPRGKQALEELKELVPVGTQK